MEEKNPFGFTEKEIGMITAALAFCENESVYPFCDEIPQKEIDDLYEKLDNMEKHIKNK